MRCNTFHLNDSITKVRQRAKISMLKLDTIRKGRRKTYNLKYKNRARSYTKEKYLLPHRGNHHGGIVITYLLLAKNKREKSKATYATEIQISKKLHMMS
jgi:hypothetical protein